MTPAPILIDAVFMSEKQEDTFYLYDLQVETVRGEKDFVCSHQEGVNFRVIGENLVFSKETQFSLYALAAILPLIPAKQRDQCLSLPDTQSLLPQS